MLRLIFVMCLATVPSLARSQMIYKIQMPDGSVMFSDTVPSGGKILEEREAKSTPRVNVVPAAPAGKSASAAPAGSPRVSIQAAPAPRPGVPAAKGAPPESASTLERELAVAKRRLELGREPLPGERRGLAGGGSRLTPEYEARIAAMERDVAATEAKLKKAYESR